MAYNNTFGKENKLSDDFKELCRSHGAYAVSIAASVYMSGQPDLSIVSKHGQETKVELKVYRGLSVPTREQILALLRGPQKNVIGVQLWRRKANCIVMAQIGASPDKVCCVSQHRISFDTMANAAKIVATLPWGQYTPWE